MITDGKCTSCEVTAELTSGGLLGQPICPVCTLTHDVAADVLAALIEMGLTRIAIEDTTIELHSPLAAVTIARRLTERYQRLGPAALFDWSGAVEFVPPDPDRKEAPSC